MNVSWTGGVTADEVRRAWRGQVTPIPESLVPHGVQPATRLFLTEVGLPDAGVMGVRFAGRDQPLPVVPHDGEDYLLLTAERSSIRLAVQLGSGRAFQFQPPDIVRFFNSDLAGLVLFLGLLRRDALGLTGVSNDVLEQGIDSVRAALTARDPASMEGSTPWTRLLDDLESQIGA